MARFKPTVTIIDYLENTIFVFEYLNLAKAKQSLEDNRFVRLKKITDKEKEVSTDIKVTLNSSLDVYVKNIASKDSSKPQSKNKFLYKSLDSRKYKAILEF